MSELDDQDPTSAAERALLGAIRRDWGPATATRDAVRAALPARLAEPADGGAPGPAGGARLLRGPLGLGIGAAVIGAVVVGLLAFRSPAAAPPAPPQVSSPAAVAEPRLTPPTPEPPAVSIDSLPNVVLPAPPVTSTPSPASRANEVAGSLTDELALIRAAQTARRAGTPAEALAALDQHAARFPHGALRDERMTLQALVLCDRGDVAAARAVRDELARVSPGSSHLQRLATSCAAP